MAFILSKDQQVSIDNSMKMALIGFGWDANKCHGVNLDVSAFILGSNGKVKFDEDFVFYNNPNWNDFTVWCEGDNIGYLGHEEHLFINFSKIPAEVEKIAITVTIFDAVHRRQNFGQVFNAYVRVAKIQNEFDTNGETVIKFDLEEEFSIETALVVCEIYRKNGEWKFNAVAAGYQGGLEALCRSYGVNV